MATHLTECLRRLSLVIARRPAMHLAALRSPVRDLHLQAAPLAFRLSEQLWAEPLKKKRKVDESILVLREQRKRKRLERHMRVLQRHGRSLKPIEERELARPLAKTIEKRHLEPLSEEEEGRRSRLKKAWGRHLAVVSFSETNAMQKAAEARHEALVELRKVSEELYLKAVKIDTDLIPFSHEGPAFTPPIPGYVSPDGDYVETTKTYEDAKLDWTALLKATAPKNRRRRGKKNAEDEEEEE